jgi:hypothetical protein
MPGDRAGVAALGLSCSVRPHLRPARGAGRDMRSAPVAARFVVAATRALPNIAIHEQGGAGARHRVRRSPRPALPASGAPRVRHSPRPAQPWEARPARPRRPPAISRVPDQAAHSEVRWSPGGCRLSRLPLSSLRAPPPGRPAGVAARSAIAKPGPGARAHGFGTCEKYGVKQAGRVVWPTAGIWLRWGAKAASAVPGFCADRARSSQRSWSERRSSR